MASDGIVIGDIEIRGAETDIAAFVRCVNRVPRGTISGEIETVSRGRETDWIFRSRRATRVFTFRSGIRRTVRATFTNAVVVNTRTRRRYLNCTITLVARRLANGRRVASIVVNIPGVRRLSVSGNFDGRISVFRQVSCRR